MLLDTHKWLTETRLKIDNLVNSQLEVRCSMHSAVTEFGKTFTVELHSELLVMVKEKLPSY